MSISTWVLKLRSGSNSSRYFIIRYRILIAAGMPGFVETATFQEKKNETLIAVEFYRCYFGVPTEPTLFAIKLKM